MNIYPFYFDLNVPMSLDGEYIEADIYRLMLGWLKDREPETLERILSQKEPNIRARMALEALISRLKVVEPGWIYLLPDSLLIKVGITVDYMLIPDWKISRLMQAIGAKKVKVLKIGSFFKESDQDR